MQFRLHSPYVPTGDQPRAIEQLTQSLVAGNRHQTLLGVTGSGKTFTLANVIKNIAKPTLVISHNKTLAAQLYQEFRDYFPEHAVSYFVSYYDYYQPEAYIPTSDTYIEKETEINDEIDKLRLSSTANLLSRPDTIVVASVSCIYNLGSPLEFLQYQLELIEGQLIDQKTVSSRLVDLQYQNSTHELRRGSFRIRGELLQVWPSHQDFALNLYWDTGVIVRIKAINPVTGDQLEETEHTLLHGRVSIYPAKHNITNPTSREAAFRAIKKDLADQLNHFKQEGKIVEAYRLGQKVKHDLDMIAELGYVNGIENYSRYFDGRKPGDPPYTLIDYFHLNAKKFQSNENDFLTIIDESHITLPQIRGMHNGDQARKHTLIDYGFRLPSALDNRPLTFEEFLASTSQLIYASATPNEWEVSHSKSNVVEQLIRPTGLVDPVIIIRPAIHQVTDLVGEILLRIQKGQRVLVTTLTKKTAEALTEYLNDADSFSQQISQVAPDKIPKEMLLPKVAYLHADVDTLERSDILDNLRMGEYDVLVGINLLREGLDLPEVSLVAILEADMQGFLRSKTSLIQTMGRAARHVDGQVIMYANKVSEAMTEAIAEVTRRREIQLAYNQEHQIEPQTIRKPIREKLLNREKQEQKLHQAALPKVLKHFEQFGWRTIEDINPESLTPMDRKKLVKQLTQEMTTAANDWDFERAANLRDLIASLKQH